MLATQLTRDPPLLLREAVERPVLALRDLYALAEVEGLLPYEWPIVDGLVRGKLHLMGPVSAMCEGLREFRKWRRRRAAKERRAARQEAKLAWQEKEVGRVLVGRGQQSGRLGFEIWHPTTRKRYDNLEDFRRATRESGRVEVGDAYEPVVNGERAWTNPAVRQSAAERQLIEDHVQWAVYEIARRKGNGVAGRRWRA